MSHLPPVKIRSAVITDIPDIIDLERRCPSAAHWTQAQYSKFFRQGLEQREGHPERLVLVAETLVAETSPPAQSVSHAVIELAGFLVAVHITSEWELENIAVTPSVRRRGIGRKLLDAFLARARGTKSEAVFLEVRESNAAARTLYEEAGFSQTGRRKAYYPDTQEDAVLYRKSLVL